MHCRTFKAGLSRLSALIALISMSGLVSENRAWAEVKVSDKLIELNGEFRKVYAQTRKTALEANNPTIICFGDRLQLSDGAHKDSAPMVPTQYTVLKTVDHVPLAVFSLLAGPQFKAAPPAEHAGKNKESAQKPESENKPKSGNKPNSGNKTESGIAATDLAELKRLIDLSEAARPTLNSYINDQANGLSAATVLRQAKILDKTTEFGRKIITKGSISQDELRDFTGSLRPLLLANAEEAIAAQLQLVDNTVGRWKKELGPLKWQKLKVVVVSGHMPRDRHALMQYFEKILGEKEEGGRVIYSEGAADEETALMLIATHDLDRSIAVNFFNEKERMHRDLLCDGASKYLRRTHLKAEE